MASSYTTRLKVEKQNPGENTNTWGSLLNSNTIDLFDEAWGVVSVNAGGATAITLTTNNGATDQGRRAVIVITGTPTSANSIIVPAVSKPYIVRAKHSGALAVKVKVAGGTGPTFLTGESGIVYADGTNVKEIVRNTSVATGFTTGMIMNYYGSVGGIPSGWTNCDGTNGTPNLNNRFIYGTTSNGNNQATGGAEFYNTTSAGSFTPVGTVSCPVITSANLPFHQHFMFTSGTESNTFANATGFVARVGGIGTNANYTMATASAGLGTPVYGNTGSAYSSVASALTPQFNGTAGGEHRHVCSVVPPHTRLLFIMKL